MRGERSTVMIKRFTAALAMLLLWNYQTSAQETQPKAGDSPSGATGQPGPTGGPSLQPGGKKPGLGTPFGGGGFGEAQGMIANPSAMFDFLARGRDFFLVTET